MPHNTEPCACVCHKSKDGLEHDSMCCDKPIGSLAFPFVQALINKAKVEAQVELSEYLMDWEDQEIDVDGRAVGKTYYVLGEAARESIGYVHANLQGQLESQIKEGS